MARAQKKDEEQSGGIVLVALCTYVRLEEKHFLLRPQASLGERKETYFSTIY